jgi:hypothetical protein
MRGLFLPLALVFGAATAASAQSSGKLNVSVAGVRNDNGSVRCGLYSSANGFREPGREMRGAVAPIKNGQATCVFNGIPAGTYAIAVFQPVPHSLIDPQGLFGAVANRITLKTPMVRLGMARMVRLGMAINGGNGQR